MEKTGQLEKFYERYRTAFPEEEIVLGNGNPESAILLIGEAPGKEEVKLSKPFVGAAGKNLSEFLDVLGLDRDSIYITNAIKYRLKQTSPFGRVVNRPATKQEIEANRPYLLEEINILNPKYIVTLGNVPYKALTGEMKASIGEVHGKLKTVCIGDSDFPLYPLYHPASIIYNRTLKDVYLEDVKRFGECIKGMLT